MSGTKTQYLSAGSIHAALAQKNERRYDDPALYNKALEAGLENTEISVENLKAFQEAGLISKYFVALIYAQARQDNNSTVITAVESQYSDAKNLLSLANKNMQMKQSHFFANKVRHYTTVETPDLDDLNDDVAYGHDGDDTSFEDDEMPSAKRPGLE